MVAWNMKILYFPGIKSLTDRDYDISQSCKLVHLRELYECDIFDYRTYALERSVRLAEDYDLLFGSSFGGFFALHLALRACKPCISVNPSIYLDKRFATLVSNYPDELSFLKQAHLDSLIMPPDGKEHKNIHLLMNLDDEILSAERIISIAEEYLCSVYTFEKGGHESSNFIGEMLPLIKQIAAGL